MKTTSMLLGSMLVALFLLAGCSNINDPASPVTGEAALPLNPTLGRLTTDSLSVEEEASLIYMREEEKLARDIYLKMYELWGVRVFDNIRRSEEAHMRAMLTLINRYGLTDPVGNNGVGVFTDPRLQALYDQLFAQGSVSVLAAYQVGVTIEQTDIADLTNALTFVDNPDIVRVYTNLLQASRSHLRAFAVHVPSMVTE